MGCFAQYAINLYRGIEVFSPPRRVFTGWISKNGSILCRNQCPFSPLIPLKAFLEIDYTESLPPLWITVAQFQSHFLQSKDMGSYSITLQGAKPGAWTSETTLSLRIILCTDSRTSAGVLGIALLSQISLITLVVSLSRSVSSHQDENEYFLQSENNSANWSDATWSWDAAFLGALMITHVIISVQRLIHGVALF